MLILISDPALVFFAHNHHPFYECWCDIVEMTDELAINEDQMTDLQKEIDRLADQVDAHIANLTRIENFHNKCELTESTLR